MLHESDVNIPVGAHDIYDEEDFCVALAKLVAGHLDVARWKFGVDADARVELDRRFGTSRPNFEKSLARSHRSR